MVSPQAHRSLARQSGWDVTHLHRGKDDTTVWSDEFTYVPLSAGGSLDPAEERYLKRLHSEIRIPFMLYEALLTAAEEGLASYIDLTGANSPTPRIRRLKEAIYAAHVIRARKLKKLGLPR